MSRESQIKYRLNEVVGPWLIPANRFIQELQRVHPEDWDVNLESSYEANGLEAQQYWIVSNAELRSLMIENGCHFIEIEELSIWCNPSSEQFGSGAMLAIGEALLDGVYDWDFVKAPAVDRIN